MAFLRKRRSLWVTFPQVANSTCHSCKQLRYKRFHLKADEVWELQVLAVLVSLSAQPPLAAVNESSVLKLEMMLLNTEFKMCVRGFLSCLAVLCVLSLPVLQQHCAGAVPAWSPGFVSEPGEELHGSGCRQSSGRGSLKVLH